MLVKNIIFLDKCKTDLSCVNRSQEGRRRPERVNRISVRRATSSLPPARMRAGARKLRCNGSKSGSCRSSSEQDSSIAVMSDGCSVHDAADEAGQFLLIVIRRRKGHLPMIISQTKYIVCRQSVRTLSDDTDRTRIRSRWQLSNASQASSSELETVGSTNSLFCSP